jgi:hypothetical protein
MRFPDETALRGGTSQQLSRRAGLPVGGCAHHPANVVGVITDHSRMRSNSEHDRASWSVIPFQGLPQRF